jgi:hypothetical protein
MERIFINNLGTTANEQCSNAMDKIMNSASTLAEASPVSEQIGKSKQDSLQELSRRVKLLADISGNIVQVRV